MGFGTYLSFCPLNKPPNVQRDINSQLFIFPARIQSRACRLRLLIQFQKEKIMNTQMQNSAATNSQNSLAQTEIESVLWRELRDSNDIIGNLRHDFEEKNILEIQGEIESCSEKLNALEQEFIISSPEFEMRSQKLNEKIESLSKYLKTCLKVETPYCAQQKELATKELGQLLKSHKKLEDSVNELRENLHSLIQRISLVKEFTNKVVENFPNAAVIDLSVIEKFVDKKGLPRLALFSPNKSATTMHLSVQYKNRGYSFCLKAPYAEEYRGVIPLIIGATGVSFHNATGAIDAKEILERAFQHTVKLERNENTSKVGQSYNYGLNPCWAESISLSGECKAGIIPVEAKKLLQDMKDSQLFDDILLLSEVHEWKVTYRETLFQSKP